MIRVKKCNEGFKMPTYATLGSACRDIHVPEDVVCLPYQVTKIPLGFQVELPYGYELQLRPRSGLSIKFPSYVANGFGVIDSDFRGEVCLLFWNYTGDIIQFRKHDRICQCALVEVPPFDWIEVEELDTTLRGYGGFGSTDDAVDVQAKAFGQGIMPEGEVN